MISIKNCEFYVMLSITSPWSDKVSCLEVQQVSIAAELYELSSASSIEHVASLIDRAAPSSYCLNITYNGFNMAFVDAYF